MIFTAPTTLWLFLGVVLIILEFSQLPGIGFLFLGLGAITTSVITNYWQQQALLVQFAYFGISSLVWFIMLWYPLKSYLYKNNSDPSKESFNIIGSSVTVVNKDIMAGDHGQVSWSGTIMNAKLADNSATATTGESLVVVEVKGNVLVCNKKSSL